MCHTCLPSRLLNRFVDCEMVLSLHGTAMKPLGAM
jgi:hypothetical protein